MSEGCMGTIATRLRHKIGRNDRSSMDDWLHKITDKNMGLLQARKGINLMMGYD